MKRILNFHVAATQNAAEPHTPPAKYFDFHANVETADFSMAEDLDIFSRYDAFIFGGGGLLDIEDILPSLYSIAIRSQVPVIVWGAGKNRHASRFTVLFNVSAREAARARARQLLFRRPRFTRSLTVPTAPPGPGRSDAALSLCALVGTRDYPPAYNWTPCVTCMDPLIDYFRIQPPQHKVVVYQHPHFCRISLPGAPRRDNWGLSLTEALAFLSSGETVFTSSYHGAYWATLLGRKVVAVPWSTKFLHFKHPVTLARQRSEVARSIAEAQAFPSALAECRAANLQFAEKVEKLLGVAIKPKFAIPCSQEASTENSRRTSPN